MRWTEIPAGQLNAAQQRLLSELGDEAGCFIDRIIKDPSFTTRIRNAVSLWEERDGVIYCSVTSFGRTGEEWFELLCQKGFELARFNKNVLRWKGFKYTEGVIYRTAIVKLDSLPYTFNTQGEDALARDPKLQFLAINPEHPWMTKLCPEALCLVHEKLSQEDAKTVGLDWICSHGFSLPLSIRASRASSDACYLRDNPMDIGNDMCVYRGKCGIAFSVPED